MRRMTTKKKLKCITCGEEKLSKHFYTSYSPLHKSGRVPICKSCLRNMVDVDDVETVKDALRKIDRPFIHFLWESAKEDGRDALGMYMKNIAMVQYRSLTWADSIFGEEDIEDSSLEDNATLEDRVKKLTPEEIEKLEDKWGYGFSPQELVYFERKYKNLVGNYPVKTSLHEEALRTYCIYKVRAELETARGNVKDAKEWATLAQKQGEIAKINLNKLTKSDLSQGLDSFSQLSRMVEQAVDIVPILPKFIEQPQDKIDFAIWCFINYERRLHDYPDVEYSDIYNFYQDRLKEYMKANPEFAKIVTETEINYDGKGNKKKLLTIDYESIVKKRQEENPNDPFIKNLKKWVEFVSWAR